MKLKNIIKPGIIGVGIGAFAAGAGEVSAEVLPWQIQPEKNQITVHVKRGDTLGEIANYLDRNFGRYDDSQDLVRDLVWRLRDGSISYSDCKNNIANPNRIESGRDISFRGKALEEIDPNYCKAEVKESNVSEAKTKSIADKNVNVITDHKTETPKKWGISLKSDVSKIRDYNKENKINNFVINGSIEYGIFEGAGSEFGEGAIIDLSAGYEMLEGLGLLIGGRTSQLDGNKYYRYKNSFFGLPYEEELDLGFLTMTELYAKITAGNKNFRVFGGYGIKSVGKVDAGLSYGWWEGEGGISKDYGDNRFKGGFGGIKLILPIGENLSIGISARYGEYKTKAGLRLKETSAGIEGQFRL